MEMAIYQDIGINPPPGKLPFTAPLLRDEMFPGIKRPGVYPKADETCVVVHSTKISALGRSKRKIGPVRDRRHTGLNLSFERIWDLCSLLYGDERTLESISYELGVNMKNIRKLMMRFTRACEYLGLNLITTVPGDYTHKSPVTYLLLTSKWRDVCQSHMTSIGQEET